MAKPVHRFYMSTAEFDNNHLCGDAYGDETIIESRITCANCLNILKERRNGVTYHSFRFGPNAFKISACGVLAPFKYALAFIDVVNCPQCIEYEAVRKVQFEAIDWSQVSKTTASFEVADLSDEDKAARKAKAKADRKAHKLAKRGQV